MKKKTKALSIFLAVVIIFAAIPFSFSAGAYSAAKPLPTLTGNYINDLIAVAESQNGYVETGENETVYGAWYGIPGGAWCAMFVSWCANKANIPTSIIPKHASCDAGVKWFKEKGLWQASASQGGTYNPKPGDIVYFGKPSDSTHVGIVTKVDANNIYTSEGNWSNKVGKSIKHGKGDSYVIGYGTPNYGGSAPTPTPTCNCSESYAGNYICSTSSTNLTIRSGHGTSYSAIGSIPKGATVYVSKADGSWAHVTYNSVSGYASISYLKPATHTHSYVTESEAAHPHREYCKCYSCGDYYYTGNECASYSYHYEAAHPHREYAVCDICGATSYTGVECAAYSYYNETAHPHNEYAVCNICGTTSYTGNTKYESTCKSCTKPSNGPAAVAYFNGHIYELYNTPMTWENAETYCEEYRGGHLLTINSAEEQKFINENILPNSLTSYYIGGTDRDNEGTFKWITGEPFTYTFWASGEPNDIGGQDYMRIYNSGFWDDEDGAYHDYDGFICEIETENFQPSNTLIFNNHLYLLYNYNVCWGEAVNFCEWQGGNLVSISDYAEYKAVKQFISSSEHNWLCWLGANCPNMDGNWKWVDGTAFNYSAWREGEPNYSNGVESCLMMYTDTDLWNDLNWDYCCTNKDSVCFVCEIDMEDISEVKSVTSNGSKYILFDQPMSNTSAQEFCRNLGGHLATITSQQEQNVIAELTNSGNRSRYWLDGTDSVSEGVWQWSDGETWSYSNWASGEPNNEFGNENYCHIYNESKLWNDTNDIANLNYYGLICEIENFEPVASITNNGTEYLLFDKTMSWKAAKDYCESIGGHLVTINNSEEAAVINSLLDKGTSTYYWLGCSDADNEGEWKWVTGEPNAYTNWDINEPNNTDNLEHYAHIYRSKKVWNDTSVYCDSTGFICEIKMPSYTITYNANGGSNSPANQTKTYGKNLVLSTIIPTRTGYTFTGWNTKSNGSGTSYAAGAKYTANADVTLYSQWKKAEDSSIRLFGTSRVDTSLDIANNGWESADTVIIANAYNFADALAGGPLSYALDAPIILTANKAELEANVLSQIKKFGAKNIVILGGKMSVNESIEKTLSKNYNVNRISGSSRFETAIAIADELASVTGGYSKDVFIAYGNNYPDALAVSAVAALKGTPILFSGANGSIDAATAKYITKSGAENATILGGYFSVAESAETTIKDLGLKKVDRVSGASRYDTAFAIVNKYSDIFTGDDIVFATGESFPDALAGGSFAAKISAPVILVSENKIADGVLDYIAEKSPDTVYILGGIDTVSDLTVENHLVKLK